MYHIIYAMLAMLLVMFFSLNLMRAAQSTQQRQIINETGTQLTGVAADVFEYLASRAYDAATDTARVHVYPPVTTPLALTIEDGAGWGGCTPYASMYNPGACLDLDDYDGATMTRDYEGLEYDVEITVRYVQRNNPDQPSATQTYAKEVHLEITNPHLLLGDNPVTAEMTRVYTYDEPTY